MYSMLEPLILASASPRRRDLLGGLGIVFDVCPASLSEEPVPGEAPRNYVIRLAREKALQVSEMHPVRWVLAADTTVTVDERILGKPVDEEDAVRMLLFLAGRRHLVCTGYALGHRERGILVQASVTTAVTFAAFDEALARAYVGTGEPYDKAGGYAIQGKGGVLVTAIDGSYSNVVGLPLSEVVAELVTQGVIMVRR